YLGEIARMALRLRACMPQSSGAEDRIVALNQFLFDDLGYWGNTDDYYDPRNSYLNEVIDRKTGTPISLSILYMELGRRIGLPLEGVSFPGHFLVRLRLRGGMLLLDPFAGGAPQSENELRERLQRVIPEGVARGVAVAELPLEQFLEPASNRQILTRVLRNLKGIYREKDKPERMLEVLNRMLGVASPAVAQSPPSIQWRLAASWPKSLDTLYGGAELVARRVGEITDGKFTIRAFAAGEIVPALQVLDAVQAGTVELGHTATYYY